MFNPTGVVGIGSSNDAGQNGSYQGNLLNSANYNGFAGTAYYADGHIDFYFSRENVRRTVTFNDSEIILYGYNSSGSAYRIGTK